MSILAVISITFGVDSLGDVEIVNALENLEPAIIYKMVNKTKYFSSKCDRRVT
jgi:hypothetical protein